MFRVRSSLAQDFEQTLFCPQLVRSRVYDKQDDEQILS